MKLRMWHSASVALMLLFGPMQNGCSSSSQQQGAEENLEPSEENNQKQEAGNEEGSEQGNEAANEEGGEEGGEETNGTEEGAENAEGGENAANEEGEGEASDEVVDEEQLTNDEGVTQADQQGDLQEIIEEMNQGEGNAATAEGGNMTESVMAENNASNASEPAGAANMANPAVEDIGGGAPVANAAPVAEAPAPSAPSGVAAAPGLPEMGSKMSYIVQKGDTLGKIAQKIYGSPAKWNEIASFTGLANPKLIYPGDVVYYQLSEATQAFASTYESMPRAEVQVQAGDTLSTIAGRVLGDASSWKLIWRQNDGINDPDKLVAGTTLFYIQPGAVSAALDSVKDSFDAVRAIVENFDADQTVSGSELDSFESDFYYQQFDHNNSANLI